MSAAALGSRHVRALWGVVLTAATVMPAAAVEGTGTAILIDRVTASGGDLVVSGELTLGTDASAPAVVATDPAGDDADGGTVANNLDIGTATIRTDLETGTLIYELEILDPTPTLRATPLASYIWQFDVDGSSWRSLFLHAGIAGSWFPPMADPDGFFRLCNNVDGFRCDEPTSGLLGEGRVRFSVPLARVQGTRGSLITGGTSLGSPIMTAMAPGVCCVALDEVSPAGYRVPGGVEISLVPADRPEGEEMEPVWVAARADGSWIAPLPRPEVPGRYTLLARSCYGSVTTGTCVETTRSITV